jgi:glycosyltransferase involved in cell wall biosynthesis
MSAGTASARRDELVEGRRISASMSVVIETINQETGPEMDLDAVLAGLARQTYPQEKLEILVGVDASNRSLRDHLRERHPHVRVFETRDSTYYSMKVAGIELAAGEIIALLDSDCVPGPIWAERIARTIERGADVAAGKTRYAESAPFSRTFNFFNFGYIQGDENGIANGFLPNNVAFRREVIRKHNFDSRLRRSGAAHLLGAELAALGYRLVYDPEQRVSHNAYGLGEELRMRVKSGYDSVNLSRIDGDEFLGETAHLRGSGFGLAVVCARRIVFDVRAIVHNRRDLDLSILQIPYFLLISPLIRGLELAAALVTLMKPDYFGKKYGW